METCFLITAGALRSMNKLQLGLERSKLTQELPRALIYIFFAGFESWLNRIRWLLLCKQTLFDLFSQFHFILYSSCLNSCILLTLWLLIISGLQQCFSILVLKCMFSMCPCSNTHDSNEWVVLSLLQSLKNWPIHLNQVCLEDQDWETLVYWVPFMCYMRGVILVIGVLRI